MENENMGKITISLSKEAEKLLRDRADRNMRSISKEVEYLITYIEKHKIDVLNPFYPGMEEGKWKSVKDKVK